jgi:hypothetical protein
MEISKKVFLGCWQKRASGQVSQEKRCFFEISMKDTSLICPEAGEV